MTMHVLAVDDSPTIRALLRRTLTATGIAVTTAEDGIEGLSVLETMQPDVIISDVNMPRMDGFAFITAVRQIDRLRATPILMLTTETAPALKVRARNSGATGWIVKPFDPQRLMTSLRIVAG